MSRVEGPRKRKLLTADQRAAASRDQMRQGEPQPDEDAEDAGEQQRVVRMPKVSFLDRSRWFTWEPR